MKHIITIGRQFGSGGRDIGQMLAAKLDIRCYDKEILENSAKKMGICQSILEKSEESTSTRSNLLHNLVMSSRSDSFEEQMAKYEGRFLRQQADKGSCIVVGRCGNYVFRDDPDHIAFFIYAPIEFRTQRIMSQFNMTEKEATKYITKTDKRRAMYYNMRTDENWNNLSQYNFILDSSVFGIEGTVDLIADIIRRRGAIEG